MWRRHRVAVALVLVAGGAVTLSLAPAEPDGVLSPIPAASDDAARPADATLRALLGGGPGRSRPATLPAVLPDRVSIVSADDALDDALVAQVRAIDGVVATTSVRSATIGLFGSVDGDGMPRDVLPRGMRIPVSVTAVDPADYLDVFVGGIAPTDAALVRGLTPGTVLLSESSAALRGLDAGGRVDLGDARGLVVAGVVDDDVARGHEFVVHISDAGTVDLGFGGRTSLLVRRAGMLALSDALDDVVEEVDRTGEEVRVWHAGRRVPLVLSSVAVKERFGEFAFLLVLDQREVIIEPAFSEANIVEERMPVVGTVRCHRLIMDDLRAAVDELIAAGYEQWLSPRRYAGCFYPRRIGFGRETLSRHSWGIAIDINVDFSMPGLGPEAPDELVAIMGRHGFRWGGDFTTPDNHHFEWVGAMALERPERPEPLDQDGPDGT